MLYAFGGSLIYSEAYANHTETGNALQAPTRTHPFGTDTIGRDILARTIYGGQISIIIGLTAMLVEVIFGVTIGAMAGYFGGWLDSVLMRITEAILVIPQIFLLLVMARYFSSVDSQSQISGADFQRQCAGDHICHWYYQLALPGAPRQSTISIGKRK